MDLDAFTAVHRPEWDRLDALASRRRLTGAEADEMLRLYQLASAHLSTVRSLAPESPLSASLSTRLARARVRFTGARSNVLEDLAVFFLFSLPAAFYRLRWLTLAVGAAFTVVGVLYAVWVASTPEVIPALGGDARIRRYVNEDFINYYSENPAASFAGAVWTNNAWVAAQEVAFGVTGLFVPMVLYSNAQNTGLAAGFFASSGKLDVFFSYILPHGLLELTAVFVAGAAGLSLFWAWVSPGRRKRLDALAQEGRSMVTVALGLVLVLFVSGLVEGFVTPSALPVWAKIGIGAAVLAAYWAYTLLLGRRAIAAGHRGDLAARDTGSTLAAS